MANGWIKEIGLTLQGEFKRDGELTVYHNFKDGSSRFGMSRDHDEVALWESNGVKITKSYGY